MGNTVTQYDSSSPYDPTLIKSVQLNSGLSCFSDQEGQTFLGREMEVPNQDFKAFLLQSIHKKNLKSNRYALGIQKYFFKTDSTVCSQIQKCLLLCRKPDFSLWQLFEEKKKNHKGFTLSEVHKVIDRITLALQTQQFNQNPYIPFDMNSIAYHEGQFYLIDSLILEGSEKYDHNIKGKYPSPQLLNSQYVTAQSLDILSCHLFSLGMISLAMIFTKNSTADLYHTYSKNNRPKKLNQSLLGQVISTISDRNLQSKIQILTNMTPETRKYIFEFKPNRSTKSNYPVKVCDNSKNEHFLPVCQQKDRKCQEPNLRPRTVSLPEKPKNISIKVVNSHPQHPLIKVNPPPCKAQKKSKRKEADPDKENLDPNITVQHLTPKKPKVKHQFSTIKQVTEYDDMSDNKRSSFKFQEMEGKYEGSYAQGKRDGFGKCVFPEGSFYEGEWKKDQMNGFGKLFYPNGKLAYEGNWLNNEFHGKGKVYCLSPVVMRQPFNQKNFNSLDEQWVTYEGQLMQDKKQGYGMLTLSNGEKFEGHFNNDFVQGEGTFFKSNGTKLYGVWKQGILIKIIQHFQ